MTIHTLKLRTITQGMLYFSRLYLSAKAYNEIKIYDVTTFLCMFEFQNNNTMITKISLGAINNNFEILDKQYCIYFANTFKIITKNNKYNLTII